MPKFIIFAHARSGSTSLANVLGASPDVSMAIEPFHEKYSVWNTSEPNYQEMIRDEASLHKVVDEIFSKYNAFKVLMYQLPTHLYLALLARKDLKVLFLKRTDYLAAAMSSLIAEQTGVWKKDDQKVQIDYSKLEPLNIDRLKEMIDYLGEQMDTFENFLEKERKGGYMKLTYEKLYSEDLEIDKLQIKKICKFLNISMPPEDIVQKYLKPSSAQLNYENIYQQIPNHDEIMQKLNTN